MRFTNPILPGFYPDPSICRVGGDYYLVNSSFEFFPGVPIHHSRDLVHWRQIGHVLTTPTQLPLDGCACSAGIWAPTIRHHRGRFYMVTTNMHGGLGNFFVHATDPAGPWSEPVRVAQGGIDPSLFFDDDGKVYFVSNGPAKGQKDARGGSHLSEIDINSGALLGPSRHLWAGTGGNFAEGPHLYKRGGWHYLMLAEGGTGYGHQQTIARSRSPWGPYEPCPHNPILCHSFHRGVERNPLKATGHGDLIEDERGNLWLVFLGWRIPYYAEFHHLGRETYLAPVRWTDDGWPVVHRDGVVDLEIETDLLPPAAPFATEASSWRDDFDAPERPHDWNHLRNPTPANYSVNQRPGWLTLRAARPSLADVASPSFLGRRQRHVDCRASTFIDFTPQRPGEEAGLTIFHDARHHYAVAVALHEGRPSVIVRQRIGRLDVVTASAPVAPGPVELHVTCTQEQCRFSFRASDDDAERELDVGLLRYLSSEVTLSFTGNYLALYATANGADSTAEAHFDYLDYVPR